jgi:galactoside O-acetyltransferase
MKSLRPIQTEASAWWLLAIRLWPDGPIGARLRRYYWHRRLKIGRSPRFLRGSVLYAEESIIIGDNFSLAENSVVDASESVGIYIGHNVSIARDVFIRAANHRFDDLERPILEQGHTCARINRNGTEFSIVIEDHVLISRAANVLTGAQIGMGAVIGAGAVVSGAVPAYSIVLGNPGRVVRSRKP